MCYGYFDADWVGDIDTKKIHIWIMSSATISWTSKWQRMIALSSTEAEYMAYTLASKEAIRFRQLLCDLGEEQLESKCNYIGWESQVPFMF
jgi:hypothetical protein